MSHCSGEIIDACQARSSVSTNSVMQPPQREIVQEVDPNVTYIKEPWISLTRNACSVTTRAQRRNELATPSHQLASQTGTAVESIQRMKWKCKDAAIAKLAQATVYEMELKSASCIRAC